MENKRINLVFNLVVIFFLALTFILIRDLNAKRAIDYREYAVSITNIVREKNSKIRFLYNENVDLKNTLAETRNALDALSKKLGQPVSVPVTAVK